jgi:hypothetical protein
MNGITNWIQGISQGFGDEIQLLLVGLAVFLCAIILVFLILLIFRKVSLWYWKVDLQVNTLKNIDEKLEFIDESVRREMFSKNHQSKNWISDLEESVDIEEVLVGSHFSAEIQDVLPSEIVFCKSKTGKIFTENELEELIKN